MSSQLQSQQTDPGVAVRVGGWLFRYRTAVPLPIAAAVLTLRIGQAAPDRRLIAAGVALTAGGELLRLWAVRHIGTISRTRGERLGPLVTSGPFAVVRNPLYIGNIALWAGFAVTARLVWLALLIVVLLALEYHAIVRWEERLLDLRFGDAYQAYVRRVPRWLPAIRWPAQSSTRNGRASAPRRFSKGDALFSERGTLIAIAAGYALIWWFKLRT